MIVKGLITCIGGSGWKTDGCKSSGGGAPLSK